MVRFRASAYEYQPLNGNLSAISLLQDRTGFLYKVAQNVWRLDTNSPLTAEYDPIFTNWVSTNNFKNGSGLTNLNAMNLTGTVPLVNMNPAVVTNHNVSQVTFNNNLDLTNNGAYLLEGNPAILFYLNGNPAFASWYLGGAGNTNSTGGDNVGLGAQAMAAIMTGVQNTAVGNFAGAFITAGHENSLFGFEAGENITAASGCSVVGSQALSANQTNDYNNAFGTFSLHSLTHGVKNNGFGGATLLSLVDGGTNLALGEAACELSTNIHNSVIIGSYAAGSNYLGGEYDDVLIQNAGVNGEHNVMRMGTDGEQINTYIAGLIHGDGGGLTNLPGGGGITNNQTGVTLSGTFTNSNFYGNGSGLTNIPVAGITGLGSLATSNSVTSNNISGSINYGQIAGVPAFLTTVTSNDINGQLNYGQIYGTPSLGTAAGSNATAFVLNSAAGVAAAGGLTNPATSFLASGAGGKKDGSGLTNLPYANVFTSTNGYFAPTANSNGSTNWAFTLTNLAGLSDGSGVKSVYATNVAAPSISGTVLFVPTNYVTTLANMATTTSNLLAPTAIGVGAAPLNWTNTTGKSVFVFFRRAAGVAISVNGTQIMLTAASCTVPLQPSEWITVADSSGTCQMFYKPY